MLQAKGYDAQTSTTLGRRPTDTVASRFPYGWRYVKKQSPSGDDIYEQVPLTTYDLLHPQEGDQVPQRHAHFHVIVDLVASLKTHYANDPSIGVFGDLIMDWGISDLPGPAPDIAIIPNLKHKEVDRGTFKVLEEGTRPCLVIEVMSPSYHLDDTKKVPIYQQAGIAEYFLIKPRLKDGIPHYQLSGYRLQDGVYVPLFPKPNPWGLVLTSQTLQLRFEVEDQGRQVRVTDLRTGQRLLTQAEADAARLAAETRATTAEARAAELEDRLRELEALLKSRS